MQLLSILAVASLFGGMLLFSIGFGTLAFKLLDKTTARKLIRDTFPYFYLFILFNSALAAVFCYYFDARACVLMGLICATTIPNRQILMPAINQASDNGDNRISRFLIRWSTARRADLGPKPGNLPIKAINTSIS